MGAYDDRIAEGHKSAAFYAVTSSTTALSYSPKQGSEQREITSVSVQNNSVTSGENILVSLDSGSNFFAVTPLDFREKVTHSICEIQVKSATGTPEYDLEYTNRP